MSRNKQTINSNNKTNNSSTNFIENNLSKLGIKTVILSSKTICDLLHLGSCQIITSDARVYSILAQTVI